MLCSSHKTSYGLSSGCFSLPVNLQRGSLQSRKQGVGMEGRKSLTFSLFGFLIFIFFFFLSWRGKVALRTCFLNPHHLVLFCLKGQKCIVCHLIKVPGAPGIFIAYYGREEPSAENDMSNLNLSGALHCCYPNPNWANSPSSSLPQSNIQQKFTPFPAPRGNVGCWL